MMRFWLAIGVLLLTACGQTTIEGVAGLEEPRQARLPQSFAVATIDEYTITAVDAYEVEALVLSTRHYQWDRESALSPVDFLLAWGPVAEGDTPNTIRWSQSWRWGRYRFDYANTPLREATIDRHAANTHIIPDPADPDLKRQLLRVRRGDVVKLKGYLVNVSSTDGWRWNTSRSRTDVGGGSCEVFFVTETGDSE